MLDSNTLDAVPDLSHRGAELPWIRVAPAAPYFITEEGKPWTPVGQNEAISWPNMRGLLRRRDLRSVEAYLRRLRQSGVTCLRLMLEYCHREHYYLERPAGVFHPNMVQLWDDLFAVCARVGMYVLLTPYDTFFTWNRWRYHPYNMANGGPCADRTQLMVCRETRELVKARFAFASRRWGSSGVLFAWDIWNEAHPAQAGNEVANIVAYIDEIGAFLREFEVREHGRAHLQTISVFGPELDWKPWLREPIFRHPALDFANSHIYEEGTIDDPRDTVAAARGMARIVAESIAEISDGRPFFDSEHGPIHTFKDRRKSLPETFDDEYFRHMQWAHLAAGGAGGGMRWPNRKPHTLTPGMLRAQHALSEFLPMIDWARFRRRNLDGSLAVSRPEIAAFGCGDDAQAVCWLVRCDTIGPDGRLRTDAPELAVSVDVPALSAGTYRVTAWNTREGTAACVLELHHDGTGPLPIQLPAVATDLALAIRRV